MRRFLVFPAAALVAVATLAASPGLAMQGNPDVFIIHGIPGNAVGRFADDLPVDVEVVELGCILHGFEFGEVAGPFELSTSSYDVNVYPADRRSPCSGTPLISVADVPLRAGEDSTLVAHLTEDGVPTLGKFVNDFSALDSGTGRVTVRHTAAAPAVDLEVKQAGTVLGVFGPLSNGEQAGPLDLPGNAYVGRLFPAATNTVVYGPARVVLKPSVATFVYAVGSLDRGFGTIVHEVPFLP